MKSVFTVLALSFLAMPAFAKTTDACYKTLETQLMTAAEESSDWGFEWLSSLTHKDVKEMIDEAMADDEADRQAIKDLIGNKNILFYQFGWNAPSNSGSTILALDKTTCEEIADVLFQSEE